MILCVCGARGIKYKKLRRQELDAREAAARVSDMERGVEGPRRPARVCREPREGVAIPDTTYRCSMVVRKISRGHAAPRGAGPGDPKNREDRDQLKKMKVWVNLYLENNHGARAASLCLAGRVLARDAAGTGEGWRSAVAFNINSLGMRWHLGCAASCIHGG